MAGCKVKGFEEQNGTVRWSVKQWRVKLLSATQKFWSILCKFHHWTNLFSSCCLLLCFLLAAFFILCAIALSLFFNAFRHQAGLPVSLLLNLSPFLKSLSYIHYYSFLDIKGCNRVWSMQMTTKVLLCGS